MQNKSIEGNGGSGSQNCREEELYAIHKRLCEDLNMDMTATEKSWQSYRSISYNYTLNVRIFLVGMFLKFLELNFYFFRTGKSKSLAMLCDFCGL